jgi:hypothetical protein
MADSPSSHSPSVSVPLCLYLVCHMNTSLKPSLFKAHLFDRHKVSADVNQHYNSKPYRFSHKINGMEMWSMYGTVIYVWNRDLCMEPWIVLILQTVTIADNNTTSIDPLMWNYSWTTITGGFNCSLYIIIVSHHAMPSFSQPVNGRSDLVPAEGKVRYVFVMNSLVSKSLQTP